MSLSRRTILLSGAALGAAGAVTGLPVAAGAAAAHRPLTYPFTLGVASGDPDHDGFVLWTRLAPQPLAEDGLGGMPDRVVPVHWEVAADERFRHVVRRGHRGRPHPRRRTACTSSWPACCPGASTSTGSAPSDTSPDRAHPHRSRAVEHAGRPGDGLRRPAPTTSTATSPPTGASPRPTRS